MWNFGVMLIIFDMIGQCFTYFLKVMTELIPQSGAICLELEGDVGKLKIRKITSRQLFTPNVKHLNKTF